MFNTLFRCGLPVHEKVYEIVGGVTVVTSPGNIIKEPPGTLKKPESHVPVALRNQIIYEKRNKRSIFCFSLF